MAREYQNGLKKQFPPTPACVNERYAAALRHKGHEWVYVRPQIGESHRQACPHCGYDRIIWQDGSHEFRNFG